jgi:Tfp pilus assembly protein FimV
MYDFIHPCAARSAVNIRCHTPKPAIRPFLIRFVLTFAVMLAAFSAGAIVQANARLVVKGPDASGVPAVPAAPSRTAITVEQGDTLWDIAQANAPKGTDVRAYLEQIKRLNHLTGATLQVGRQLLLP